MAIVNNIVSRKNKPASKIYTIEQVQTTFRKLWEEENHLIIDNTLPYRTNLIGDIYAEMVFSNKQNLKKNDLSNDALTLIKRYI